MPFFWFKWIKWIQWFHKNLRWHTTQTSRHDIDSSIGEVPGLGVLDPLVAPPSSAWNGEAVNQTVHGISQTKKCIQESIWIYLHIFIYKFRCRLWVPRACGHVLFYTVTKYQKSTVWRDAIISLNGWWCVLVFSRYTSCVSTRCSRCCTRVCYQIWVDWVI